MNDFNENTNNQNLPRDNRDDEVNFDNQPANNLPGQNDFQITIDQETSTNPTDTNVTTSFDDWVSAADNTSATPTDISNEDVLDIEINNDDVENINTPSMDDVSFQNIGGTDTSYNSFGTNPGQSYTYYTENIKKPKRSGYKKGLIAAILVITVLNLSAMGGMFYMGTKIGRSDRVASSRQALIDTMRGNNSDTTGAAQTVATGNELSTTEIAKKVGPAVVGIKSTVQGQMTIFGTSQSSEAQGSGIILSEDGYIVTNNHVVDGASSVVVQLNTGTEIDAKLIGKDSQTDLAVIKIEPTEQLTVATLGDSSAIEVGERVVAIGNPMGLEFFGTVTQGIVSGVNRSITVDNRTMNVIQTDAAINSGNSGGALINRFGEVIGINSVKVSSSGVEGMGFAIPSSEAKLIVGDLIEHGYVKGRPVIGISTRDVTDYMARSYSWPQGVQIMEVTSESPRSAGLAQGDIITEADGQKVTDTESLNQIKNTHSPGDKLKLTVYKYATGKTETVEITLSEQLPS